MDKNMVNEFAAESNLDNEIDIREVVKIVWNQKLKVFSLTLLAAVLSVIYAVSLPNYFKASVLLMPAQNEANALSGSMSQIGGLASLAGLGIGSGESTEAQIAIEIMQSWNFIERFILDEDILVPLIASEGFDTEQQKLVINSDLYDSESNTWLIQNERGISGSPTPTSWQMFQAFSEIFTVSQNRNTGLVTAEIEFFSAKIARDWLDKYVYAINQHMQRRQITKISNNIAYLNDQISKTSITEMQEVFYAIVEEQIKSKMLAEASPEYVFVTVSPSMIPELKSRPQRAYICILGTLLGAMLSLMWILASHYLNKAKHG